MTENHGTDSGQRHTHEQSGSQLVERKLQVGDHTVCTYTESNTLLGDNSPEKSVLGKRRDARLALQSLVRHLFGAPEPPKLRCTAISHETDGRMLAQGHEWLDGLELELLEEKVCWPYHSKLLLLTEI